MSWRPAPSGDRAGQPPNVSKATAKRAAERPPLRAPRPSRAPPTDGHFTAAGIGTVVLILISSSSGNWIVTGAFDDTGPGPDERGVWN